MKGLDGHDIVLSRTGVTQPGYVDVIHGEGMPIYHLSGHGDLFVEYQVVFPPTLSTKLKIGEQKSLSLTSGFGSKTNHLLMLWIDRLGKGF